MARHASYHYAFPNPHPVWVLAQSRNNAIHANIVLCSSVGTTLKFTYILIINNVATKSDYLGVPRWGL